MDRGVTLVWRSDVHLADTPPRSRIDDWASSLLEKLTQVGKIAERVKAQAVIDGGDLFHVKSPSRTTHELVSRVAAVQSTYPCPVYGNVGNHDVKYGSIDFLGEAPLNVLFRSGNMQRLYDQHEASFSNGGVTVRVVGVPYHGTEYDHERFTSIKKGSEDYLIGVAHVLASPQGGTLFENEDVINYSFLAETAPDAWLLGHWHKNQGVVETHGKMIVNIGSVSRGSISQDDVNRVPSVAVLGFSKKEIKIIPISLDVKPAIDVFNFERKILAEEKDMTMDAFVDNLKMSLSERVGGSLIDHIRSLSGVSDNVRERAVCYLERTR